MATAAHLLYACAIALFLGLSIGLGSSAFYPDPDPPGFPYAPTPIGREPQPAPAEPREREAEYQRAYAAYEQDLGDHRRNLLIGVTALATVILFAAIAASSLPDALRLGFLLGGLGTMVWAVAHTADDVSNGATFAAVFLVFLLLAALSHPRLRGRMRRLARLSPDDRLLL